jgi:hypothetical protein
VPAGIAAVPHVLRLRVCDADDPNNGFYTYLDFEPMAVAQLQPDAVDFSTFSAEATGQGQRISVQGSGDRVATIERVECAEMPLDVQMGENRKSFVFQPRPPGPGIFAGRARVEVRLSDRAVPVRLEVPFQGMLVQRLAAQPPRIALLAGSKSSVRRVQILDARQQPVPIRRIGSSAPWVEAQLARGENRSASAAVLTISPAAARQAECKVTIECDDGSVCVPVVLVGKPAESAATQPVHSEDELAEAAAHVREALARFDAIPISEEMATWVKLHALIGWGPCQEPDRAKLRARLVQDILAADNPLEPVFVVRRDRPWPRKSGEMFLTEDHRDQYLHCLSVTDVPLDTPLRCQGRTFQLKDLLEASLADAIPDMELPWTVSAYARYLKPGQTWKNKFGQTLSLGDLVRALLQHPGTACGGTHALYAMARVLDRPQLRADKTLDALWPALQERLDEQVRELQQNQQEDGEFRLSALKGDGKTLPYRIVADGHSIEWLSLYLPAQRLREPWLVRAATKLCEDLLQIQIVDATDIRDADKRHCYGDAAHAVAGLRRWLQKTSSACAAPRGRPGEPEATPGPTAQLAGNITLPQKGGPTGK